MSVDDHVENAPGEAPPWASSQTLGGQASGGRARLAALALVIGCLVAGVLWGDVAPRRPPHAALQPAALAAEVAPAASQSSAWYCAAGSGSADPLAQPTLLLVNASNRRLAATVTVVDEEGKRAHATVFVPAHRQIDETPGNLERAKWLAATVEVDGGGLSASELVYGRWGTAVAPCASESSAHWYFAAGSTSAGNSLYVSLFNPTASLAVVDLAFQSPTGEISPLADQGLVVDAGSLVTVTVGAVAQQHAELATVVSARSGSVVAAELELHGAGGALGMSLTLGSPSPVRVCELPRTLDVAGGTSNLYVLNPTPVTERVRADVRLPSGPEAPFGQTIAPGGIWDLVTSAQLRIPVGTDYSMQVSASGPGVVVERTGGGISTSPSPEWGAQVGVPGAGASAASRWLVPSLGPLPAGNGTAHEGAPGASGASGASGAVLVLQDPSPHAATASIWVLTASGFQRTERVEIPGGGVVAMRVGDLPLHVVADRPVALELDASPAAAPGLLTAPALPQA